MTSNALKASYKYQIKRLVFVPLLIVGYEILILVFSALLISYFDMDKSFISLALPEIAAFGASLYCAAIISDFYNTAAANGCSKRTALIASVLSAFTMSAVLSAIIIFSSAAVSAVFGGDEELLIQYLYGMTFDRMIWGESAIAIMMTNLLMLTLLTFTVTMIAECLGTIAYRLSKKKNIVFFCILWVVVFAIPMVIYIVLFAKGYDPDVYFEPVARAFGRAMGFRLNNNRLTGDILSGIITMLLASAASFGISFAVIGKAFVKPLPIRQ